MRAPSFRRTSGFRNQGEDRTAYDGWQAMPHLDHTNQFRRFPTKDGKQDGKTLFGVRTTSVASLCLG